MCDFYHTCAIFCQPSFFWPPLLIIPTLYHITMTTCPIFVLSLVCTGAQGPVIIISYFLKAYHPDCLSHYPVGNDYHHILLWLMIIIIYYYDLWWLCHHHSSMFNWSLSSFIYLCIQIEEESSHFYPALGSLCFKDLSFCWWDNEMMGGYLMTFWSFLFDQSALKEGFNETFWE